jgi:hypothetical protein
MAKNSNHEVLDHNKRHKASMRARVNHPEDTDSQRAGKLL